MIYDRILFGTVAVFKDLYGNLWDFVQLRDGRRMP